MDEMVNRQGFKTSELFVLAMAHVLVLLGPKMGFDLDSSHIMMLLTMDTGYMGLRGGQKIATVLKQPKKDPT